MAGDQIVEEIEQQALLGWYEEGLKLELSSDDWRIADALCLVNRSVKPHPEIRGTLYKNILRAGFSEACLRENWIPAIG